MPNEVTIGDLRVTLLSDGVAEMANAIFPDFDPALAGVAMDAGFAQHIWAFVIRTDGQTILVDTGSSGNFGTKSGRFHQSLAEAGIGRDAVDRVFLTHMHSDHYGGLLMADGAPAFPEARLSLSVAEWDTLNTSANDARLTPEDREVLDRARASVAPYRDRCDTLAGGQAVAPGIVVVPLPGHTAGHAGLSVDTGAGRVLFLGDVVHCPDYQMAQPAWSVIYDDDPQQAAETRRAVLGGAADDASIVFGAHLGRAGFGRVARVGTGFRLVAAGGPT